VKEIRVGKESKKMVPTEIGNQIVKFLLENFAPVMDIKFTADFEEYLDKVAIGKAKWYNILSQFYELFNPICIKLSKEVKTAVVNADKLLGVDEDTGFEIYYGEGKYGPYVKRLESLESTKWKYAAIKNENPEEIELDDALELLKYPIDLGTFNKNRVLIYKGQFGLYIKYGEKNISLKDDANITLESIKPLLEGNADKFALKTFTVKNKTINVKNGVGTYGPFLQIISGKTKSNIPIPKSYDVEDITLEDVLTIIADKNGTKK